MSLLTLEVHHYFHPASESEILARLDKIAESQTSIKDLLMTLNAQQQAVVDALNEALAAQKKTAAEITALQGTVTTLQQTVADLETAVNNAGNIPQEIVDLVGQVKDQAIAIDNQIPDIPASADPAVDPNAPPAP